ncbi:MAG: alpha/beta hydrolase [Cyanobacteria bacterium J06639_14]
MSRWLTKTPIKAVDHLWRQFTASLGIGSFLALATASIAIAAERIEFFIGPFEPVIWVEDLTAFVEDGTITDRFSTMTNSLDEDQLTSLRSFLNASLEVDLITVSQVSYWGVGERFLNRLGQVIQTDSFLNGGKALRAALIAAAADDDGITTLEVIQAYPLDVIQLDFPRMQQIIQENQRFFANRAAVIAQLRSVGEREAQTLAAPTESKPVQAGPYAWQLETLTFDNPLRGDAIPFDLYLPQPVPELSEALSATPVIVISHGVASNRNALSYLAQYLASHGYAVAVPQHDDDSQKYVQFLAGVEDPPHPITLVSRPRDISSVLDALENLVLSHPDYAHLDLDNVGVLGHSLGGFTVLAAAGAELNFAAVMENCSLEDRDRPSLNPSLLVQCDLIDLADQAPFQLRDDRIRAVFALNPPTSLFFGETGLAQLEIPTLMMAAMADIVVPAIPEQIEPYRWLQTDHKYLVAVENATHFTFLEGDLTEGALPLPSALLGPDPQQARPYLQALSLAFFDRHLCDQVEAEASLTQPYLDSLGTDPFRLEIVRSLDINFEQEISVEEDARSEESGVSR